MNFCSNLSSGRIVTKLFLKQFPTALGSKNEGPKKHFRLFPLSMILFLWTPHYPKIRNLLDHHKSINFGLYEIYNILYLFLASCVNCYFKISTESILYLYFIQLQYDKTFYTLDPTLTKFKTNYFLTQLRCSHDHLLFLSSGSQSFLVHKTISKYYQTVFLLYITSFYGTLKRLTTIVTSATMPEAIIINTSL